MTYMSIFAASSSALRGHALALNSIADSVVNQTTAGYKQTETRFVSQLNARSDTVYPSYGGLRPTVQNFIDKQGTVLATTRDLDVGIAGRGFFVVNSQFDKSGETLLTRSGSIQKIAFDNNGSSEAYLADVNGNFMLGWPSDGAGGFSIGAGVGSLQPMRVDSTAFAVNAVATTSVTFSFNLPAEAVSGDAFNTGVSVFDVNGNSKQLNLVFTRQPTQNEWQLTFASPDGTVTGGSPVTVTFDSNGDIVAPTTTTTDITWTDVTAGTSSVAFDLSGTKSFGGNFTPFNIVTNGAADGFLTSINIESDGRIVGNFSNGISKDLYKLPLGIVRGPDRLEPRNGTLFAITEGSGALELREADKTGLANFVASALESSTVDLGGEFTKLIVTQRAYSTAATAMRTVDEMVKTATDLI